MARTYWQPTEIEATFRSLKSEIGLRPIWHAKQERIRAHLFIAVLAYHGENDADSWRAMLAAVDLQREGPAGATVGDARAVPRGRGGERRRDRSGVAGADAGPAAQLGHSRVCGQRRRADRALAGKNVQPLAAGRAHAESGATEPVAVANPFIQLGFQALPLTSSWCGYSVTYPPGRTQFRNGIQELGRAA